MKLYIDISNTFINWTGEPTGIQRTIQGISKTNQKTTLIAFNRITQCWHEIQLKDLEKPQETRLISKILKKKPQINPKIIKIINFLKKKITISASSKQFLLSKKPIVQWKNNDTILIMDCNWHIPYFMPSLKKLKKNHSTIQIIGFFYDLIPIRTPGFVPLNSKRAFKVWADELMQLSTFAITDSDFVAKDLFDYYSGKNIKEGTIFKIHGKIATHKAPPSSVPFGSKIDIHQEKNRIHDPTELIHYLQEKKKLRSVTHANLMLKEKTWLISVNSIDIRKNIITQIHALKPLWESKQLTLPLVLIGRICFGVSDMLYLIEKDPILSKYVIIFNSLSDNLCWSLWEKAQVCLFTSWYEGFGLPVSESLQLGCPVIASCSTAIPEVAGNLIDYIEPWDTKALQEKVLLYCDPHSEHRKKRLKQLKKFKPTTWDETIEAIIKKI